MSRNIMTITKWLPVESVDCKKSFLHCMETKAKAEKLLGEMNGFLSELNKGRTETHEVLEKLESFNVSTENVIADFSKQLESLVKYEDTIIMEKKITLWKGILWKIKVKLCFCLKNLINKTVQITNKLEQKTLATILKLSITYNKLLEMDSKFGHTKNITICSNSCPYLLYPLRKLSITRLVQIIACNKAEVCAHKLIDCLLETFRSCQSQDDDDSSSNSSIEIYRAITGHMSPPSDAIKNNQQSEGLFCLESSGNLDYMEELILNEQQTVLDLLSAALKAAPNMLGSDTIKKSRQGELKVSLKAQTKVLDYYQEILWGEVGTFLEHIILWWGSSPLAARSPHSSQHLREWIITFISSTNIPTFISSALTNLADALGVHVTSTIWDEKFRLALVASKSTGNSSTGSLFCDVLRELVLLCNQCEVTNDWVIGAPLEEIPIVEQIPVLHRLDHSVHTTRLWAASESKKMANNWDMKAFFAVIRSDIVNCILQLNLLRLTDYATEIEKGGLGVHVQVCANMRAKLVSEVKENVQKLKNTPVECLERLASICRVISLANLQMVFPNNNAWKQSSYHDPEKASPYVETYLHQILSPVLAATEDPEISNMILKLMCESWLDHIYVNKIKFSQQGALQLLRDFAYVTTWLTEQTKISEGMKKKMIRNEVLRRCEGVGRLLLRSPGEQLKMNDKNKKQENSTPTSDKAQLMPAEMYVPNQEQWLELRANTRKPFFKSTICCSHVVHP